MWLFSLSSPRLSDISILFAVSVDSFVGFVWVILPCHTLTSINRPLMCGFCFWIYWYSSQKCMISPWPEAPISTGHQFPCNTVNTGTHALSLTHTNTAHITDRSLIVGQMILHRDTGLAGVCNKYIKPDLPHGRSKQRLFPQCFSPIEELLGRDNTLYVCVFVCVVWKQTPTCFVTEIWALQSRQSCSPC